MRRVADCPPGSLLNSRGGLDIRVASDDMEMEGNTDLGQEVPAVAAAGQERPDLVERYGFTAADVRGKRDHVFRMLVETFRLPARSACRVMNNLTGGRVKVTTKEALRRAYGDDPSRIPTYVNITPGDDRTRTRKDTRKSLRKWFGIQQ